MSKDRYSIDPYRSTQIIYSYKIGLPTFFVFSNHNPLNWKATWSLCQILHRLFIFLFLFFGLNENCSAFFFFLIRSFPISNIEKGTVALQSVFCWVTLLVLVLGPPNQPSHQPHHFGSNHHICEQYLSNDCLERVARGRERMIKVLYISFAMGFLLEFEPIHVISVLYLSNGHSSAFTFVLPRLCPILWQNLKFFSVIIYVEIKEKIEDFLVFFIVYKEETNTSYTHTN